MRLFLSLSLLITCTLNVSAQNFEGKLVYQNNFKSKSDAVPDEMLSEMLGSAMNYYIKENQYKTESNGKMVQWQIYNPTEKKLYTKMSNSESIFWNDVTVFDDEILSSETNKAVTEVLGYVCDEIIFKTKDGIQKFYYNSKLAIDPKLYTDHKYSLWSDFVSRSGALPLKIIIESAEFTMESTVIEIKPMAVETKFFVLPEGLKAEKSPF
ncbi:MAG TPA: hypothetical protein VGD26_08190 [Chitinophagaceae bacterium]